MKKKLQLYFLALSFFIAFNAVSQAEKTQNPVLFGDVVVGHAWGAAGGFTGGAALHVQTGRSLFTGRFTGTTRMDATILSPFIPIPVFEQKSNMEEYAVLYGRRFIKSAKAYSISMGVSYSTLHEQLKNTVPPAERKTSAVGLPFEAGIKWFKSRKERIRIYGIFPVGRPTGLGASVGLKLLGNISRYSYAGIAFSVGFGYHKQYE